MVRNTPAAVHQQYDTGMIANQQLNPGSMGISNTQRPNLSGPINFGQTYQANYTG